MSVLAGTVVARFPTFPSDAPHPVLHVVREKRGERPVGPRPSLTPRGRVVVGIAVVLAVVLVATGVSRAAGAPARATRAVTVQAGQTLSHVAARELPSLPTGTAVAELQLANRLNTTHVHAGQVLRIPETR